MDELLPILSYGGAAERGVDFVKFIGVVFGFKSRMWLCAAQDYRYGSSQFVHRQGHRSRPAAVLQADSQQSL